MFVVVQEIGSPFTPCAVIYTVVLAGFGGFELAEGTREGFGGGFFSRGRWGRRFICLDGSRLRRCTAEWPLRKWVTGGAKPLGEEEAGRSCEEKMRLEHC